MALKILLLEDDHALGETLKDLLEDEGYSVTLVEDANSAIDESYENHFDLYIFDINLPDMNGADLLESLRNADDTTPTIFISALTDIKSIARGFEVGGDDYIKKPFMPEELLIRIKAKIEANKSTQKITIGSFEYDFSTKTAKKDGKIIALGEVGRNILEELLKNRGQIVDKMVLLDLLEHPSDSALRVAINKLKKLTSIEIKNVRGVGYSIEV